jgi:hypothetical protein
VTNKNRKGHDAPKRRLPLSDDIPNSTFEAFQYYYDYALELGSEEKPWLSVARMSGHWL